MMMKWSKPMPGISSVDNILLIKYLKTGGKKKDLNAIRSTRGFKDREIVTHYLSKCQGNVKALRWALSTRDTTQMLL